MLRAGWRVLIAAVLLAAANPLRVVPQVTPEQLQPEGTARLVGRVVAADDGRPVPRAYLRLSGLPASEERNPRRNPMHVSRHLETGGDGGFEFAGLPAGSYHIGVEPQSGFVRLSRPKEVRLTDDRTLQTTIRLDRTGAIVGRVLDEGGEAVVGAQLHAVRRSAVGDHETISYLGRSAAADERGENRLYGLAPGEYYVVATYRPIQMNDGSVPVERMGFSRTYYPASSTSKSARGVTVRAGRDTRRVNFRLAARPLARVTVNAVNAAGVPLVRREAMLTLWDRDEVFISGATHGLTVNQPSDGTFVFQNIPPGEYRLLAKAGLRSAEAAYVDVTVGEEDVSVNVRTNVGATVSGRVLIDGQPANLAPGSATYGLGVAAGQPPRSYGYSYAEMQVANVRGTDRFELRGLRGPTVLTASRAMTATLSIRAGGKEIAGEVLEFVGTETVDDVVVELTTATAAVEVTVVGQDRLEEPEPVIVVAFAEDPALWRIGHVRYTTAYAPRETRPGDPRRSRCPCCRRAVT